MKRLILLALALIPIAGNAQPPVRVDRAVLMSAYDLDGEAADADQIVTLANGVITDDGTYTLTADPDTCRLVDITVVDTNLTAGTLTVVGTGCVGEARSCSFAFTAGDDTGVKTLTCTDGEGAYFSDVSAVTTGTMTGESDETFTMGYTTNSVNGWAMYGRPRPPGPNNENGIDPWGVYEVGKRITTSAVSSTTVTGVLAADDVYELVSVGDLLIINVSGTVYERKVTARASADSITVHAAINIPAAGVTFKYKKLFFSTNPADDVSIPVAGYTTLQIMWSIDANANTGGVVTLFECTLFGPEFIAAPWEQLSTTTTASGATQVPVSESVDLTALPYNRCRLGTRFGTGDDADGAAEDINAVAVLLK